MILIPLDCFGVWMHAVFVILIWYRSVDWWNIWSAILTVETSTFWTTKPGWFGSRGYRPIFRIFIWFLRAWGVKTYRFLFGLLLENIVCECGLSWSGRLAIMVWLYYYVPPLSANCFAVKLLFSFLSISVSVGMHSFFIFVSWDFFFCCLILAWIDSDFFSIY